MKHLIKYLAAAILILVLAVSCKRDDYLVGGNLHNPKVDLTTYDYLKTNPIFDTLVQLIDRASMKDEINSAGTFFAPTDYSINKLMRIRTGEIQNKYNDESLKYRIDSFPVAELKDSLRIYLFTDKIQRENLATSHKIFKNKINQDFSIRLIISDDYTGTVSTQPRYLQLIKIINGLDPDDNSDLDDEDKDIQEVIQTSGIITQTGVLHVINNEHTFYWNTNAVPQD